MGAFVVAAQPGATIVPIAIRGTRTILRPEHRFPRRGAIDIAVSRSSPREQTGLQQSSCSAPRATPSWASRANRTSNDTAEPIVQCHRPRAALRLGTTPSGIANYCRRTNDPRLLLLGRDLAVVMKKVFDTGPPHLLRRGPMAVVLGTNAS